MTRASHEHDEAISHAVGLIALELAHRSQLQVVRRQAIGMVLEDIITNALTDRDATEKLRRSGLEVDRPNTVVIARAHRSSEAMLSSPWDLKVELGGRLAPAILVAAVHRDLVIIVPEGDAADGAARLVAERLRPFVGSISIGVGNPYPGVGGLRLSHAEASAAAAQGSSVNQAGRPHLADLMVATSPPGVDELARQILGPLIDHDGANGTELLTTLRVLLEESGSSGKTAGRLFVHRNTVGQRIQKIIGLTGFDPTNLPDATELWLALAHHNDG